MNKYFYDGPVMEFDICIADHRKGETMANSKKKAISNLTYQFKKHTNRANYAKITLPGEIKIIG